MKPLWAGGSKVSLKNTPPPSGAPVTRPLAKAVTNWESTGLVAYTGAACAEDAAIRYILKDSAVIEISQGLLAVAAGQHYVSSPLTVHLLNRNKRVQEFGQRAPGLQNLTDSERRILRMIAEDKSSKQIADELNIHFRTVENRRTLICQKLGLHGNNALLKFALQHRFEIE